MEEENIRCGEKVLLERAIERGRDKYFQSTTTPRPKSKVTNKWVYMDLSTPFLVARILKECGNVNFQQVSLLIKRPAEK